MNFEDSGEVFVDGLRIPNRLVTLVNRGLWPRTREEELKQNLKCLVPEDRIRIIAPEQNEIYFLRPPFVTVAYRIGKGDQFWSKFGAQEGISPQLSLVVGSFGLGSDAPILLDYRENRADPAVIRLKWNYGTDVGNVWMRCANSFDEFADLLRLDTPGARVAHPNRRN